MSDTTQETIKECKEPFPNGTAALQYWLQAYRDQKADHHLYGAYPSFKKGVEPKQWLKFMSCTTKEPCISSFTNIRGCVDYIFYDDGENKALGTPKLFELVRTLDVPSYGKFLKGNIQSLPHAVMPSDHLSMLAEFIIL